MRPNHKEVTKQEFLSFLDNYPNELKRMDIHFGLAQMEMKPMMIDTTYTP